MIICTLKENNNLFILTEHLDQYSHRQDMEHSARFDEETIEVDERDKALTSFIKKVIVITLLFNGRFAVWYEMYCKTYCCLAGWFMR